MSCNRKKKLKPAYDETMDCEPVYRYFSRRVATIDVKINEKIEKLHFQLPTIFKYIKEEHIKSMLSQFPNNDTTNKQEQLMQVASIKQAKFNNYLNYYKLLKYIPIIGPLFISARLWKSICLLIVIVLNVISICSYYDSGNIYNSKHRLSIQPSLLSKIEVRSIVMNRNIANI